MKKKAFTPLEKYHDFNRRLSPRPVRKIFSNKVKKSNGSLTGFTLIEVAIVIGIFAVMIAILMPIVRLTQERAHNIKCANNLRVISLGLHMYAADHNGAFPQNSGALYPVYVKEEKIFDCPASKARGTPDMPDYDYVAGLTESSPSSEVIVYDKDDNHKAKGKNILRINGSVERVSKSEGKPK